MSRGGVLRQEKKITIRVLLELSWRREKTSPDRKKATHDEVPERETP
jgi:hypothetical protein